MWSISWIHAEDTSNCVARLFFSLGCNIEVMGGGTDDRMISPLLSVISAVNLLVALGLFALDTR